MTGAEQLEKLLSDERTVTLEVDALDTHRALMRANEETAVSTAEAEHFRSVVVDVTELLGILGVE